MATRAVALSFKQSLAARRIAHGYAARIKSAHIADIGDDTSKFRRVEVEGGMAVPATPVVMMLRRSLSEETGTRNCPARKFTPDTESPFTPWHGVHCVR
jgi:hypothetical protein